MTVSQGTRSNATRALGSVVLLAGLALAGCSKPAAVATGPTARVYAADVTGGAKVCDAATPALTAGKTADATIKVGNDGGWCGILVHQDGPKPYEAGLLTARPAHGTVLIHSVGDDTRVDYTPDHGFTGTDTFAVKLLPGDEAMRVSAIVTTPVAKAQ